MRNVTSFTIGYQLQIIQLDLQLGFQDVILPLALWPTAIPGTVDRSDVGPAFTSLLQPIMFTDIFRRGFYVFMTVVMHSCACLY